MIPKRTELEETDIVLADFTKWADQDLAIANMIWNAHWAHMNYIFVDKNLFSQETLNKVKEAGYNLVIGYGEAARIKISW